MDNSIKFHNDSIQVIRKEIYCVIATVKPDGSPWATPVFYAVDQLANFYWISERISQHSSNIEKDSRISLTVFTSGAPEGTGNGVYFSGAAKILTNIQDISHGLNLLKNRANKSTKYEVSDVTNDSPWRLYRFTPNEAWTLGEYLEVRGWPVDRRVSLDLEKLMV